MRGRRLRFIRITSGYSKAEIYSFEHKRQQALIPVMKPICQTGVIVMSQIIQALLDALTLATFQNLKHRPDDKDTYVRRRPQRHDRL